MENVKMTDVHNFLKPISVLKCFFALFNILYGLQYVHLTSYIWYRVGERNVTPSLNCCNGSYLKW